MVATALGGVATIQHPIYLKLPVSMQAEMQAITSEDFSLRRLKYTLCALVRDYPTNYYVIISIVVNTTAQETARSISHWRAVGGSVQ